MSSVFRGDATARLSIGESLSCARTRESHRARTRETDTLAMLDASDTPALDTSHSGDSVLVLRDLIECMEAELKFKLEATLSPAVWPRK